MSEETTKNESSEPVLSEEDMLKLKQAIYQKLASSISFTEVVQITNNMLAKEVDERVASMSDEELLLANSELSDSENQN
jgi:hypothetical protein